MVKILVFSILLPGLSFAQEKIEGIGIFKVGKTTTEIINEAVKPFRKGVKEIAEDKYKGDGSAIYKLIYKESKNKIDISSPCPNTEIYYLQRYIVADIKLVNVYLTFYNNILISFSCDTNDDLEKALELKYGKPALSSGEKPSTFCVGRSDKLYESNWTNGNVKASIIKNLYYNVNCRLDGYYLFQVYLPESEKEASSCKEEYIRKLMDPSKAKKLKEL